MTTEQRRRISDLRYKGYTENRIAELVGVPLADVKATKRKRGRPRSSDDDRHAAQLLADALAEKNLSEATRYRKVRCILANFGDELGLSMCDAKRLIEGR